MRAASEYARAVGYFRSSIFVIAWPALREFARTGGTMRILCSQVLAPGDVDALEHGYGARADGLLSEEVRSLLDDPDLAQPARILAALVAHGIVDIRIATMAETTTHGSAGRIFHDKMGIFADRNGDRVTFRGSMNETWNGLSNDGNLESIDVAASWEGQRDLERVCDAEDYFEALWEDRYPRVLVRRFPDVAREEFVSRAATDWPDVLERLLTERLGPEPGAHRSRPKRQLRPHQRDGLAAWRANKRRGILAFATGSGKTFTAITGIREALTEHRETVVVIVPDTLLFDQWLTELRELSEELDVKILPAGAGHDRWRNANLLGLWTRPQEAPRIVLATIQTASSDEFLHALSGGDHLTLVADEVHRLGSRHRSRIMEPGRFGARLGLSATPERAGDPEGTERILDYFDGILEPRYSLADAVRDGVLTPYFYRPHPLRLTDDEAERWQEITTKISRMSAQVESAEHPEAMRSRIERLLIERARIVKKAAAKTPLAVDVLREHFEEGQRWIVYCEDRDQLDDVAGALHGAGMECDVYHSAMDADRSETLRWFSDIGGIVVAIRCLDEGVDIPEVTHALILASSQNPREFVQRRGRVLRAAPGKSLAYVHDAIVVPAPVEGTDDADLAEDPILAGELARAIQFSASAANPASGADLARIAIDAGLDWQSLLDMGSEHDDDE